MWQSLRVHEPILSQRQAQVLQALVGAYVGDAAPVGSATLAALLPVRLSSASVRSTLGELHELGLLEQAHRSAGRIPDRPRPPRLRGPAARAAGARALREARPRGPPRAATAWSRRPRASSPSARASSASWWRRASTAWCSATSASCASRASACWRCSWPRAGASSGACSTSRAAATRRELDRMAACAARARDRADAPRGARPAPARESAALRSQADLLLRARAAAWCRTTRAATRSTS